MLARTFRQNQPAVLFLLAVVVPLVWPASPLEHPVGGVRFREGMPLYALVAPLWTTPWYVRWLVGVLFTAGMALLVDRFSNDAELFDRRNHLPALLFPLVMALGPTGLWPEPAFLGLPWVLWSLSRAWSVQGRTSALGALFDAGLLMGIAALWYMPYLFLVVVIWASVSVMRPFIWRDHVLALLGLVIPLFLCWGVMEVLDIDTWHPLRTARDLGVHPALKASLARKGLMALVLVPMGIAAVLAFMSLYQRSIMREKNVRSSFLAATLAMLVLIGFERLLNGTYPSVLMAMPVAVLFTHALLRIRRTWLAELAVFMLLGLALWVRWVP